MSATLTAPVVHGRDAGLQDIPLELLQMASQLRRIGQEGASGGTFVEEMLALAALYHSEDGRWQRHWDIRGRPKRWE